MNQFLKVIEEAVGPDAFRTLQTLFPDLFGAKPAGLATVALLGLVVLILVVVNWKLDSIREGITSAHQIPAASYWGIRERLGQILGIESWSGSPGLITEAGTAAGSGSSVEANPMVFHDDVCRLKLDRDDWLEFKAADIAGYRVESLAVTRRSVGISLLLWLFLVPSTWSTDAKAFLFALAMFAPFVLFSWVLPRCKVSFYLCNGFIVSAFTLATDTRLARIGGWVREHARNATGATAPSEQSAPETGELAK